MHIAFAYKQLDPIAAAAACENNILRWSPLTDLRYATASQILAHLADRAEACSPVSAHYMCGLWHMLFFKLTQYNLLTLLF